MSWSGVKKQSYEQEVKSWCEEMGIKNYTINSQGEIDVNADVNLRDKNFEELPYKFGKVNGYFDIDRCKNLISLKNCPNETSRYFSCDFCSQLDSIEMCPREVGTDFFCKNCKQKFTSEKVRSLCKVGECLYV